MDATGYFTFKTTMSGRMVEALVERSCRSAFRIDVLDIDTTASPIRKKFRVAFSHPKDQQRFQIDLRKLAATAPRPIVETPRPETLTLATEAAA